jgi:hypothetical protein
LEENNMAFEIDASVKSVVNLGVTQQTYFEIFIEDGAGNPYPGNPIEDVDTIVITGPSGVLPYTKDDFIYNDFYKQFFLDVNGAPEVGEYTFEVTIDGDTEQAIDTQGNCKSNHSTIRRNSFAIRWFNGFRWKCGIFMGYNNPRLLLQT